MAFAITAELPLGTYRGSGADGRPERLPSVVRLHSALLSAAGFGPRAVLTGSGAEPCPQDAAALRWVEEHPPDAISVPPLEVNRAQAVAYREDGTLRGLTPRKVGKPADASVAVGGAFRWRWDNTPPAPVVEALAALCGDVSHLGTTTSPVRLRAGELVDDTATTHRLDATADLFSGPAGTDVDVPTAGRSDELAAAHRATAATPRPRSDAVSSSETSSSPVPPRARTALARYVPVQRRVTDAPWDRVLLLPLSRSIAVPDRVRFCVAAHRSLVAAAAGGPREDGGSAPPLITGLHAPGSRRPANGLALQVVDAGGSVGALPAGRSSALALLVPRDAAVTDLAVLAEAVGALRTVGRGRSLVRITDAAVQAGAPDFWDPPPAGSVRAWRTVVPAVPETRGAPGWTFREAALLSLAYVWRHRFGDVPGRGLVRADALVRRAAEVAEVLDARPLRTTDVGRYAHSTHQHAVVRPYQVDLRLDEAFFGRGCLQALGQSRHVGGGLLRPVDVDAATLGGRR